MARLSCLAVLGCCALRAAAVFHRQPQPDVAQAVQLGRTVAKAADEIPLSKLGPLAIASGAVAARLPTDKASQAWGVDKVKTLAVLAGKDGEFELGGFNTGGLNEEKASVVYGVGYRNLEHRGPGVPSEWGVAGAAKVTPGSFETVNAIPSAKGGLDYGQLKVAVTKGHLSPDQMNWAKLVPGAEGAQELSKEPAKQGPAEAKPTTQDSTSSTKRRLQELMDQVKQKKAAHEKQLVEEAGAAAQQREAQEAEAARRAVEAIQEATRKRQAEKAEAEAAAQQREAQEAEAARRAVEAIQEAARKRQAEEAEAARRAAQAVQDAAVKKQAEEAEALRKHWRAVEQEEAAKRAAEDEAARRAAEQEEAARAAAARPATPSSVEDWLANVGKAMKDWSSPSAGQARDASSQGSRKGHFFERMKEALSHPPTPEQLEKRKQLMDGVGKKVQEAVAANPEMVKQGKEFMDKIGEAVKTQLTPEKIAQGKDLFKNAGKPQYAKVGQPDWLKKLRDGIAAAASQAQQPGHA